MSLRAKGFAHTCTREYSWGKWLKPGAELKKECHTEGVSFIENFVYQLSLFLHEKTPRTQLYWLPAIYDILLAC